MRKACFLAQKRPVLAAALAGKMADVAAANKQADEEAAELQEVAEEEVVAMALEDPVPMYRTKHRFLNLFVQSCARIRGIYLWEKYKSPPPSETEFCGGQIRTEL